MEFALTATQITAALTSALDAISAQYGFILSVFGIAVALSAGKFGLNYLKRLGSLKS